MEEVKEIKHRHCCFALQADSVSAGQLPAVPSPILPVSLKDVGYSLVISGLHGQYKGDTGGHTSMAGSASLPRLLQVHPVLLHHNVSHATAVSGLHKQ